MRQPRSLVTSVELGGPFVPFGRRRLDLVRPRSGWSRSALGRALRGVAARREATAGGPARLVALGARGRPRSAPGCSPSRSAGSSWPSRPPTPRSRCSARRGPGTSPSPRSPPCCSACTTAARRLPLVPHGAFAERPAWGATRGQLLRRRRADRRAGRHPDLRADHHRRRVPDQGRAGAGRVPGRAARRRAAGRRTHPAAAGRVDRRGRDGPGRARVLADGRLGLRLAAPPDVLGACWR